MSNEPRHDKTNKMSVPQRRLRSAWASAQADQSSLSVWRKLGSLDSYWAHSEDWSDWANAQADLSLRWVHIHFVGFVMLQLKYVFFTSNMFFFWHSGASYYNINNLIWPNSYLSEIYACPCHLQLWQRSTGKLVICNFDKDQMENEHPRLSGDNIFPNIHLWENVLALKGKLLWSEWSDLVRIQTHPRFYACPGYL